MSELRWRTENVAFLRVSPSDKTTGFLPLIKAVIRASRSIGDSGLKAGFRCGMNQGQLRGTFWTFTTGSPMTTFD